MFSRKLLTVFRCVEQVEADFECVLKENISISNLTELVVDFNKTYETKITIHTVQVDTEGLFVREACQEESFPLRDLLKD